MTTTKADGWHPRKLGDFFRLKHGYAFKGEYFADKGEYVLLTPGNFGARGGIKLEKIKYYVGEFPKDFLVRRGDLLVVMTDLKQDAPILGAPAFVPEDNKYLHNQRLGKIIDLAEDQIDKRFLYYLFNYQGVRNQIKATATGATVRHTAPERIYSVNVDIPPYPVQRGIASILSGVRRQRLWNRFSSGLRECFCSS